MGSLSLTPEVRVFPCPHCGETINTSARTCPFCAAPIDAAAAEASAAETSRISQACSDASFLRIMLGLMVPAFLVQFIPFVGAGGLIGLILLKYAVPIMAVRWGIKYGRIQTTDPDYPRARKTVLWVGLVGLLVLALLRHHIFGLTL